jgi:hypothetical protein
MRSHAQAGQVLPLIALTLAVLMGFGGLAVDVGYWEYTQRQQQNATDAGAIGGAEALLQSGSCPNGSTVAVTAGRADASSNGFTDGSSNVAVSINNPPSAGTLSTNSCAVQAQITSSAVPTFFTRLLGPNFLHGISVSTAAVAYVNANNDGCIYMLDSTQNTNFHGGNIQAPACDIYLNGSANFNGATVDSAAIGEANYAGSNNGGTFTGASPKAMPPVSDPCAEISGCAYLKANPPPTSPCNAAYSGGGVLTPGCYNNLNLNGATVTLQSGLYVFAGSLNANKASITGTGVTMYIPSGGSTNFNKVNSLTLTAPTSGDYTGVAFYQDPGNTSNVNLNGSSTNISGLIYAPGASMNYNGSLGGYTVLVAAYANLNNSTGEDFGTPPAGNTLIKKVSLAQ